jgi:adenine-specific DNA-methyltransferase
MKKLTVTDPETKSADVVAENLAQLKALFPELMTEGPDGVAVNIDVLKALVGDKTVSDADEKYGLNWHGKRRARQLALTPSTGTLRPCLADSVDWDTTQNLMIEGDNLEVLKLLQKSYAGKVKLIYIDPPYNTGKDFVYADDFKDNLKSYLELTGQAEGGRKVSSNTEANGRFHTDWLNMLYPRLLLARPLLDTHGYIAISIDNREIASLLGVCDAVFGEANRVGIFIWRKKSSVSYLSKDVLTIHEYVLMYGKTEGLPLVDSMLANSETDSVFHVFQAANEVRERVVRKGARLKGQHEGASLVMHAGEYRLPSHSVELLEQMVFVDGVLVADARVRGRFGVGQDLLDQAPSMITVSPSGMMYQDKEGRGTRAPLSIINEPGWSTRAASASLEDLFGGVRVFDHPKPIDLMRYLIHLVDDPVAIVLDFFAGSGTTGHAVMAQNAIDGGSRRFILVQLPEPLDPGSKEQTVAASLCDRIAKPRNIAELTVERLRRSAKKVKDENPVFAGDLGFRVFKLDSSNIRAWEPDRDNLEQTLLSHAEHLKKDRAEQDVLFELLLKLGLDLCVPIETRAIAGKTVQSIGGGVLLACLAKQISRDEVEPLAQGVVAWHRSLTPAGETTCVFRDSAFADDVAKTNLAAILNQHGLATVRSL